MKTILVSIQVSMQVSVLALWCLCFATPAVKAQPAGLLDFSVSNEVELLTSRTGLDLRLDLSACRLPEKTRLVIQVSRLMPIAGRRADDRRLQISIDQFRLPAPGADGRIEKRYSLAKAGSVPPPGLYRVILSVDPGQHPAVRERLKAMGEIPAVERMLFVGSSAQALRQVRDECAEAIAQAAEMVRLAKVTEQARIQISAEEMAVLQAAIVAGERPAAHTTDEESESAPVETPAARPVENETPAPPYEYTTRQGIQRLNALRARGLTMPETCIFWQLADTLQFMRGEVLAALVPPLMGNPPSTEFGARGAAVELCAIRHALFFFHYYVSYAANTCASRIDAEFQAGAAQASEALLREWEGIAEGAAALWGDLSELYLSDENLKRVTDNLSLGPLEGAALVIARDNSVFVSQLQEGTLRKDLGDYAGCLAGMSAAWRAAADPEHRERSLAEAARFSREFDRLGAKIRDTLCLEAPDPASPEETKD